MAGRRQLAPFVAGLLLVALAPPSRAQLQEPDLCPEGAECIEVRLAPGDLTGDFYVDDRLIVEGQNAAIVPIVRGQTQLVRVRNIQEPSAGFGELYIWKDARHTLRFQEGQALQDLTITPRRAFIAGVLNFRCEIPHAVDGEEVYCTITIDGTLQPDPVEPGTSATYFLAPGIHKVFVWGGGEQADRWRCCGQRSWSVVYENVRLRCCSDHRLFYERDGPYPAYKGHTILMWAGRTRTLAPSFVKAGNLVIELDEPDLVGDVWIDGELVASQVNAANLWLPPTRHEVEVLDITGLSEGDAVLVVERPIGDILLKPGETRVIDVAVARREPQHAAWLSQVGQCFMAISFAFAIPWMFSKRRILESILDAFNDRHTEPEGSGWLESRVANTVFSLVILAGHLLLLSAVLAWLAYLIIIRLTDWPVPEWAPFAVAFAVLGAAEFPRFARGHETRLERFIQRLIAEKRLRNLMGYVAFGLFFAGLLLYFKATGQWLDTLPDWGPDV